MPEPSSGSALQEADLVSGNPNAHAILPSTSRCAPLEVQVSKVAIANSRFNPIVIASTITMLLILS